LAVLTAATRRGCDSNEDGDGDGDGNGGGRVAVLGMVGMVIVMMIIDKCNKC
jgi:hypothetical protein